MINILPERGRKEARRTYMVRLSITALFAASAAMLIMAAFLSSGYLNSLAREEAAREEARVMEGAGEGRELEAPIAAARDELDAYEPLLAQAQVSESIAAVLAARNDEVALSLISYDRSTRIVRASGVAMRRESLLSFERAARELPLAAEVQLPVSDLARSTNAPFSLTIRLNETAP